MTGFVTVACKMPNGLILELPGRPRVTIRGSAVAFGVPPLSIAGGYALTSNVDADFFKEWMTVNSGLELVKKRFIFAHDKASDAAAQAKEMSNERTGFEPVDQDNPGKGIEKISA